MWLDLWIIVLVALSVYRGRDSGFVRQFFGSFGFFGGLVLGRLLETYTIRFAHTTETRASVTIATLLGTALICLTISEYAGFRLKRRLLRLRANRFDNSLGSVMTILSVLLSVWLMAAISTGLSNSDLQRIVKSSHIVRGLNQILPPAPNVIAGLGHLIDPNGFPDVFIGNEPIPRNDIDLPSLGDFAAAVENDRDSVVRLEGQGCGGIVSGSGFVVDDDLIVTNAHVVAGIKKPYVQDPNGRHEGTVVVFDPKLDLALLRVPDLAGQNLIFQTTAAKPGTAAVVLGFPGGGDFAADAAAVLSQVKASGHDIYGKGSTVRDIYEVKAKVIPGNSGGPLINKDGDVIGVIFAESTSYNHVGYALTASKVADRVTAAQALTAPVNTGKCAQ